MSDYRRIRRKPSGRHKYVRPKDTLSWHRASKAWLGATLAPPHDGPTVVATHHAPHLRSLPSGCFDLAHCYASDLAATIADGRPNLWVRGHVHAPADYRIGTTRIVCNPRGHAEEASATTFIPNLVIDIRRPKEADMQALRKPAQEVRTGRRRRDSVDHPAGLARFLRLADADPRAAAFGLAHWLDCRRVHHEGSDLARALDTWAYDPDADSLDAVAWTGGRAACRLPVRPCGVAGRARRGEAARPLMGRPFEQCADAPAGNRGLLLCGGKDREAPMDSSQSCKRELLF